MAINTLGEISQIGNLLGYRLFYESVWAFLGSGLLGHWLYCLVRVWNITIKLVETYGRLVLCVISVFLFYIFSHKLLFKIPFRGKKSRFFLPLETGREIEEV